jgi:putative phosphoribosyl transferase
LSWGWVFALSFDKAQDKDDDIIKPMFKNRAEAGRELARKILKDLEIEKIRSKTVVLAIPRGGVVIGKELARALNCPLDVMITKKIGAPGNPELAIGAVGPSGEEVIDEQLAARVGADEKYIKNQKAEIRKEIKRQKKELRGDRPPLAFKKKVIVLTDDGVATGATMLAGIEVLRQHQPQKIIVAVPVIARDTLAKIEKQADAVIYLEAPLMFFAVGQFYQNFPQISNKEVKEILK